jgi:signal transduction histidine kinase
MLRSLRSRLLLLTVAVAGVALVAAGLVSRVAVRTEFHRLETTVSGDGLASAAELLSARFATPEEALQTPSRVDSELVRLAATLGQDLVLVGPDNRVLATSNEDLRSARVSQRGEIVQLDTRIRSGGVQTTRRALIREHGPIVVHARDGGTVGSLVPFPRQAGAMLERESRFLLAMNRWLLIAVLVAGLLALLLALALSRRILGPIEVLTQAARRLEAGDLGQRTTLRSDDEIGELSRAFNAMAESLQRQETLRKALVTDVAHELRTPLTNLRCQIEAVQDGLLPVNEATLRSLHEETALLSRLVDDLQDLALAEAGQLPLDRRAIAPGEAIANAITAVGPRAAEHRLALRADVEPHLPPIEADPARLGQILRNLLANALTHTPDGGTITVTAAAANGVVEISVADTGPGIAPEHLPHVFDRFYRADPSRARGTGGAGLGLSIVKQLAAAHGGNVRVVSEPGRGARFTLTIPAASS